MRGDDRGPAAAGDGDGDYGPRPAFHIIVLVRLAVLQRILFRPSRFQGAAWLWKKKHTLHRSTSKAVDWPCLGMNMHAT